MSEAPRKIGQADPLRIPTNLIGADQARRAFEATQALVKASTGKDPTVLIAHAYALVPIEGTVDQFRAVHLENVSARSMTVLEPNGRPERAQRALQRILHAATERFRRHAWGA